MKLQLRIRSRKLRDNLFGYCLITPLLIGIFVFTAYPMLQSLYYSFFEYNFIGFPQKFIGLSNYKWLFTGGASEFWQSCKVTLVFCAFIVPLTMILSFLLAVLLNINTKGIKVFRLIYYIPCLIPTVVLGIIWKNTFNPEYGVINMMLQTLGLPTSRFFDSATAAMPTFIFMQMFGIGGSMIMWLAGLRSISPTLYESAQVDGAGKLTQLLKITIPMSTPYIFYNLIMTLITSLQTFSGPYVLLNGTSGVDDSMLFYVLNIYNHAFKNYDEVGIASAMSWVLFIVIILLTAALFGSSGKWVFYGGEDRKEK